MKAKLKKSRILKFEDSLRTEEYKVRITSIHFQTTSFLIQFALSAPGDAQVDLCIEIPTQHEISASKGYKKLAWSVLSNALQNWSLSVQRSYQPE